MSFSFSGAFWPMIFPLFHGSRRSSRRIASEVLSMMAPRAEDYQLTLCSGVRSAASHLNEGSAVVEPKRNLPGKELPSRKQSDDREHLRRA
jgi:hypothetical protein